MKWIALGSLTLTALGGAFLFLEHRRKGDVPLAPGLVHGAFGLSSFASVWRVLLETGLEGLSLLDGAAGFLLTLAVGGGLYLLGEKHRALAAKAGGSIPAPVAKIHAGIGASAVVLAAAAVLVAQS